ncbi:MAG: peptidyl-prolyl cis-trans isomerase [Chloroflexi bacterium]|nr:peptidyl-prolyl cis-trans isomerase [Chloroflexota bacterium]
MKVLKHGAVIAVALLLAGIVVVAGCGEKMAATVNGAGISTSQVDIWLKQYEQSQQTALQGRDASKNQAEYRKQILDSLIEQELVKQEAKKRGISVSDQEVEKQYSQIRTSAKKTEKEVQDLLKKQGMDLATFKDYLRTQLITQKFYQKLTANVKVTDKDAQQYYDKNKDAEFKQPEKVKVQQIMTDKEDVANNAKQELGGGADFASCAKKYSIDASKDKGGEVEMSKDQAAPDWAKEVFAKNPGETTGVFKAANGYYIVKVLEKTEAKQTPFADVKEVIKQQVLKQKKDATFLKWLQDTKKKAEIRKNE